YQALDPELAREFAVKKLRYVRNFVQGLDVKWQDFFKTENRSEVEAQCAAARMDCHWGRAGELRVSHIGPAVVRHPRTHEHVFFNQLQLHHIAALDPRLRSSILELF